MGRARGRCCAAIPSTDRPCRFPAFRRWHKGQRGPPCSRASRILLPLCYLSLLGLPFFVLTLVSEKYCFLVTSFRDILYRGTLTIPSSSLWNCIFHFYSQGPPQIELYCPFASSLFSACYFRSWVNSFFLVTSFRDIFRDILYQRILDDLEFHLIELYFSVVFTTVLVRKSNFIPLLLALSFC